jgi:hypothetical protein
MGKVAFRDRFLKRISGEKNILGPFQGAVKMGREKIKLLMNFEWWEGNVLIVKQRYNCPIRWLCTAKIYININFL